MGPVKFPQLSSAACNHLFSAQFKASQRSLPPSPPGEEGSVLALVVLSHLNTSSCYLVMTILLKMTNSLLAPGQLGGGGCTHLVIVRPIGFLVRRQLLPPPANLPLIETAAQNPNVIYQITLLHRHHHHGQQ